MFGRCILAAAVSVAAVAAQSSGVTITNPGPNSWWVAGSINTLAWTCDTSSVSEYTVAISNPSVMSGWQALIASVPNYDCSYSVNQQQSSLAVSNNWTIALTNNVNLTDIYATAQFAVEAQGSPYPASSSSAGASGTATSTAGSSSSTSSSGSSSSGAAVNYIPVGMSMAAAILLGLVVA